MTTAVHSPGKTERRTATGTDSSHSADEHAPHAAAVAALLHRISGGLNNAAMAFELAMGAQDEAQRGATDRVLGAGLAGVQQAARGIALLNELLSPGSTPPATDTMAHLTDVIDILRSRASMRTVALNVVGAPVAGDDGITTPALAVASLLEGLSALEHTLPGSSLPLEMSQTPAGPQLRIASTAKDARK